jgi:hypothetical protein
MMSKAKDRATIECKKRTKALFVERASKIGMTHDAYLMSMLVATESQAGVRVKEVEE